MPDLSRGIAIVLNHDKVAVLRGAGSHVRLTLHEGDGVDGAYVPPKSIVVYDPETLRDFLNENLPKQK